MSGPQPTRQAPTVTRLLKRDRLPCVTTAIVESYLKYYELFRIQQRVELLVNERPGSRTPNLVSDIA